MTDFRKCKPSGVVPPVGSEVLVGNSLFVSSQGKLIIDGAVRESLTDHFLDINEAIQEAIAGDTIYVYGGFHLATGNLQKQNVTWNFLGYPIVSASSSAVCLFDDLGNPETIAVNGTGIFINNFYGGGVKGKILTINNVNTILEFECYQIQFQGSYGCRFLNGRGNFTCIGGINKYGNDFGLDFGGTANYTINTPYIENSNASTTSFSSCVSLSAGFNGNVTINSKTINHSANQFSPIRNEGSGGKLTINGSITYTTGTGTGFYQQAIWVNGFSTIVLNGELFTNSMAYRLFGGSGNTLTVNSKIIGFGMTGQSLISALTDNNNFNINADLEAVGNCPTVINIGGNNHVVRISNCRIVNNDLALPSKSCYLVSGTGKRFINNVSFVNTFNTGVLEAITSTTPQDIRILQGNAGGSDNINANITNIITGTVYIFDTDYI